MEEYKQLIRDARIVELDGYGKGLPLWLPYGLKIANNLVNIFVDDFSQCANFTVVDHPYLIPRGRYLELFEQIGFENIYSFDISNESFVVKPDNLQFNFEYLFDAEFDAVASRGSGYRFETGIIPPLFRDRRIWPFFQLNQAADEDKLIETLELHTKSISNMLDALCIPHFFADSGKKRLYGLQQINGMSFTEDGDLTIISMSYVLSDTFSNYFNTDKRLIDTGFTEKLIAMMALLNKDEDGLILPSALAPYNVVTFDRKDGVLDGKHIYALNECGITTHIDKTNRKIKTKFRDWGKRGANVILLTRDGEIEKVVRRFDWGREEFDSIERISEVLKENDSFLRARARERISAFENGDRNYYKDVFCEQCVSNQEGPVFGEIFPQAKGECACGLEGTEYLVTLDAKIY